ncbi:MULTISPECIES: acyltransferase domain-containing protein [unclassified Duganella]|uniref:acyltransferase domain-containing protein n=1 Tax=unclassified Duganella TaxID=2636909 RepID=UPI0006F6D9B9|nr:MULTISPECIES: acyltransferase domain-containing protein [unclassified Duganella]KQV61801.1 malonyl CoA-ACP transacylase [Duganella sp. Root336D2]KRB84306.1 malonyl CoA-ACP transacylase [Duganella sp. Root198D2]
MKSRLLVLCPGQGSQHGAMYDLARRDPHGAALLAQLAPSLPDLSDPGAMFSNRSAQPAIVASTLAMWEALRRDCPQPALVAGYSVGELAAYGVAGAFTPERTIALAARRAALMDACVAPGSPQAMLAVSGRRPATLRPQLAAHGFHIAIETGEDSCIAGGPAANAAAISIPGARIAQLPVAVASHTPYLQAAVEPFATLLAQEEFGTLHTPVLGGIDAMPVRDREAAISHLSRQLAETIVWSECMDACAERGITAALELGPGNALSKMLSARHPGIDCRSVADFRSMDGIRNWLAQF